LLVDQGDRDWPREASRVRVLVVDDQDYFRGIMCEVVEATDGFELVGEATSGEAALEAVEELSPMLVVMDKRMPGIGGIGACRALTESHPEIVVVMTSVEEPPPSPFQGCVATFIRKQELSPQLLRELWSQRQVRGLGLSA
jgi:DNA-binding NarL/FixJ family response regulator